MFGIPLPLKIELIQEQKKKIIDYALNKFDGMGRIMAYNKFSFLLQSLPLFSYLSFLHGENFVVRGIILGDTFRLLMAWIFKEFMLSLCQPLRLSAGIQLHIYLEISTLDEERNLVAEIPVSSFPQKQMLHALECPSQ